MAASIRTAEAETQQLDTTSRAVAESNNRNAEAGAQGPRGTLVMKFGGTSVGTAEAVRQSTAIVVAERSRWARVVVVASALAGVTNALLASATQAAAGDDRSHVSAAAKLRADHAAIVDALVPCPDARLEVAREVEALAGEFSHLCHAVRILGEASPRALDAVAGLGERMSVRVLAAVLRALGVPAVAVDATDLIVTDDAFMSAHPDLAATRARTQAVVLPLLRDGRVPVVTGFIGATPDGAMTTLGRGGGDYSAAIVAAALPADEMWDWTDVDGVMTCDPRVVKQARTIAELSEREVAELAYFGAKVLHPMTIRPVVDAGIALRVCNTFNPQHPGTRIVPHCALSPSCSGCCRVKSVTAAGEQRVVRVQGRGVLQAPAVLARTFGAVATTGASVQLVTQSSAEQSVLFTVPAACAPAVVARLEEAFARELQRGDVERVWASGPVATVTAVGEGLVSTPGVGARLLAALAGRGINVLAIAQGSSDVSVSVVVDGARTLEALEAIHGLI
eukprot:m51a1_g14410 putative aspartate kinase (508) ;mRNA; f:432231-433923